MRTSRSTGSVVAAAVGGLLASALLLGAIGAAMHRRGAPGPAVQEAGSSREVFLRARDDLVRDAPAVQAGALRDRRVTATEYEAAVQASARCLADDLLAARPGLAARPPTFAGPAWSADRFTYSYDFSLAIDDLDPRPLDRSCQQRYSRSIEALFHLQRWADPAFVARSTAAFHACLDAAGLPRGDVRGPRARFRAVITDPSVDEQSAIEARKCIGARPSIGDLTP